MMPRFRNLGFFLAIVAALAFVFVIPCLGGTQTRTSAFEYDPSSDRLIREIIEPDNSALCVVTTYQYDVHGKLVQETRPNNDVTNYQYDSLERLGVAENSSGEITFTYDDAGHLIGQTSCAPQPALGACQPSTAASARPPSTPDAGSCRPSRVPPAPPSVPA